MSTPPPAERAGSAPPGRSLVVRLEEPRGRRLLRGGGPVDAVTFTASGTIVEHARALREPLVLPPGTLALAAVDPGPAKAAPDTGRFAVLRRLGPNAVVPREEGIEGWVWTGRSGSALPALGDDDEAPNGLLLFARPLAGDIVARAFEPAWVRALADRSPLGDPVVAGLLLRLAAPGEAERAFREVGLVRPVTDREVPPALRRSLPTDRPADPAVRP
ncbi:MAG TPA: hypothetical protein VN213_00105, partial [Solirubrobacteraceae bacterium]|nr:hypothetical protein [Solirubrobacteraceae bacterium]